MNNLILFIPLAGIVGVVLGYLIRQNLLSKSVKKQESKAKELILSAKDEALKLKEEAKKEDNKRQKYLQEIETNLRRREETLDRRAEILDKDKSEFDKSQKEIETIKQDIKKSRSQQLEILEKLAKLKKDEAKELLLKQVEKEYKDDIISKIRKSRQEAKEEADVEGQKILATVIQRIASEQTAELTVSPVQLPNEEMKGRIIGKEGRNIQVFEKATGVDIIIDETPDAVVLSCFDPVRRYIAKVALENLLSDGRIHPTRIEECVKKAENDINKLIKEAGEQAAYDAGVPGLNPDLLKILGRLKFRTSYGQNMLTHSLEVTKIAEMLAQELNADVNIVKKAALLHDIGKALTHEIEGTHLQLSVDIAKKYGMSQAVIHAIEAHHDDVEARTVEAIVVKAADAISGSRPGARRETLESYVKRLTELENIANSFKGVDKSFAIQAGREVRILVRPEEIGDLEAIKLAKDIAKKIEQDMQYPGMIKVNVIRETRATEFAK